MDVNHLNQAYSDFRSPFYIWIEAVGEFVSVQGYGTPQQAISTAIKVARRYELDEIRVVDRDHRIVWQAQFSRNGSQQVTDEGIGEN